MELHKLLHNNVNQQILILCHRTNTHLRSNVVVHGVDNIVQQVDVQFLTEVQQLSGWMIRQHCHFCWHRASEGQRGEHKLQSQKQ